MYEEYKTDLNLINYYIFIVTYFLSQVGITYF